jgi:RNA polymerase sigma factor (sigma-70 family)
MSLGGMATASASLDGADRDLVEAVREGDDGAFEELYRRYQQRITSFVRRIVRDEARAEDVTQEAFLSALRRMRATDSEIAFKPWIYEIARNAAIDSYRRTTRAEEISMDGDLLRPLDRGRLVGSSAPFAAVVVKERLDHLRGALDELSDTHHRILVMRELEGLSYREIGERMELTRPAVESTLFRARRRLEREYEELDTGRRCKAMGTLMARVSSGVSSDAEARRLARHTRRCGSCRMRARELGVQLKRRAGIGARAAALLPLPAFLRRRTSEAASGGSVGNGGQAASALGTLAGPGSQLTVAISERAAALVAAAAIAGAGGAVLAGIEPLDHHQPKPAAAHRAHKQAAPARSTISGPRVPGGHREGASTIASPKRLKRADDSRATQPGRPGAAGAQQHGVEQGSPVPALPEVDLPVDPSIYDGPSDDSSGRPAAPIDLRAGNGVGGQSPPAEGAVSPTPSGLPGVDAAGLAATAPKPPTT